MEKISYILLLVMLLIMAYFISSGAGSGIGVLGYLQVLGFALATVIALVALSSIPVVVYCYFVKKIPDIDYSINVAFGITIIGIISELVF